MPDIASRDSDNFSIRSRHAGAFSLHCVPPSRPLQERFGSVAAKPNGQWDPLSASIGDDPPVRQPVHPWRITIHGTKDVFQEHISLK